MLRNLDALTTEESVLTALQKLIPKFAKTITKVLISRDTLTQTSRGFCYLNFETLVDSMDVHNALTTLDPPLRIDDRDGEAACPLLLNRFLYIQNNTSSSYGQLLHGQ